MYFILLLSLVGCQAPAPTRVTETQIVDLSELNRSMNAPIEVTGDMIVLDARGKFEYTMMHVIGSAQVSWEDYSQVRGSVPGKLQANHLRLAQRLALLGIEPNSPVLIVGKGLKGNGEEGRLAWTLYYLGINKIQIADLNNFSKMLTNVESTPRKNAELWNPQERAHIEADLKEVLAAATSKAGAKQKTHLIDVRSKAEYFNKIGAGLGYSAPDIQAIHIEWKEFFQADGRPNPIIKDKLRGVNIELNDRVILISDKGLRSSAVTMALLALGFRKAASYSGGYTELLRHK